MFRILDIASSISFIALAVLKLADRFGLIPKFLEGSRATVYVTLLSVIFVWMVALAWRVFFTNARRIDSANVDVSAAPEREFVYRGQKCMGGLVILIGLGLAFPLMYWPYALVYEPYWAHNAAWPCLGGLMFACGLFLIICGRRYWNARITFYADRMEVRGIYSNGSLKWAEATEFAHAELTSAGNNTIWVYFVCGTNHTLRVEGPVQNPDDFVRMVQAKTSLKLKEYPVNPLPEPVVHKHKHRAFRK
jgi:hypothetical protein